MRRKTKQKKKKKSFKSHAGQVKIEKDNRIFFWKSMSFLYLSLKKKKGGGAFSFPFVSYNISNCWAITKLCVLSNAVCRQDFFFFKWREKKEMPKCSPTFGAHARASFFFLFSSTSVENKTLFAPPLSTHWYRGIYLGGKK